MKKERRKGERESGRVAVLSCFLEQEEKRGMWSLSRGETNSNKSLVGRYALVNATLTCCLCLQYTYCQAVIGAHDTVGLAIKPVLMDRK